MNHLPVLLALSLLAAPSLHAQDSLPLAGSLDASKLVAFSDSFAFLAGGQPIGGQRLTLEPLDDGWRFTERTVIEGRMEQETVLVLGPDLVVRSVRQHGTAQGDSMGISVDYAEARALGRARTLGADGVVADRDIDVELPAGAVDDNALQLLLPALPWTPDAVFHGSLFSSGRGEALPVTLRVAAVERVEVPAGEAEAFRVEMVGQGAPAVFWVTTAAPHSVIKVGSLAAPIEFVRVAGAP